MKPNRHCPPFCCARSDKVARATSGSCCATLIAQATECSAKSKDQESRWVETRGSRRWAGKLWLSGTEYLPSIVKRRRWGTRDTAQHGSHWAGPKGAGGVLLLEDWFVTPSTPLMDTNTRQPGIRGRTGRSAQKDPLGMPEPGKSDLSSSCPRTAHRALCPAGESLAALQVAVAR